MVVGFELGRWTGDISREEKCFLFIYSFFYYLSQASFLHFHDYKGKLFKIKNNVHLMNETVH